MLLTAGPASPALQTMPVIGKKSGMDWAKAVVEDPANREGFRESVLRSELRSSPGCSLQGTVTGVAEIGNMGAIGTAIQAECAQAPTKLSGEFYSAYDGTCEYQVQLVGSAEGPAGAAQRLSVPLRVEASDEAELADVSADPGRLKRLAESTGGETIALDQLARLPGLLSSASGHQPRFVELRLWDSVYLFVFVLACLGAEWALRKRFGLA